MLKILYAGCLGLSPATVLIQLTSVTDGQTDGRTDRRPDDGKDERNILLSRVKMHQHTS